MQEVLRTTRPVGVTKDVPILGHEDPTACKRLIDWDFFHYDQNRDVYIRKSTSLDERWIYTGEFMRTWSRELEDTIYVMRDEFRPLLLGDNK